MKVKGIERIITLELQEDELLFLCDILRASSNDSAITLAGVLREALAKGR